MKGGFVNLVEVKNISKSYGEKKALDNVSFCINKGEVLGFLGPNGAGKTTTMNIMTGYISCSAGQVFVCGEEILENPIKAKAHIGYLPEQPPLYLDMTVKGYLSFLYDLKKLHKKIGNKEEHIKEILEKTKIEEVYERLIKNLSKGYKQRVGLAGALLGNPEVLILDEPTVGLDPKQIIEVRDLIKSLKEKHTIMLSSHVLPEVQAVCDRVIVINDGKIVADDTARSLFENTAASKKLILEVEGNKEKVKEILTSVKGVVSVDDGVHKGNDVFEFEVEFDKNIDIRKELFRTLINADVAVLGMNFVKENLEKVFLDLTNSKSVKQEKIVKLNEEEEVTQVEGNDNSAPSFVCKDGKCFINPVKPGKNDDPNKEDE